MSTVETPTVSASCQRLRSSLTETLPYCSGTLQLSPRDSILYYGGKEDPDMVDLSGSSIEELNKLQGACDPATFGRDDKDVYDETYRKAGKMDVDKFMLGFDAERSGLVEAVRTLLFPGKEEEKKVKAELYKLNVYGEGSFFKGHKDTPRAKSMFGSLVVVFPTAHEGGALLLRQDTQEWAFDSSKILFSSSSTTAEDGVSIAFVAFFSDVEHEVAPVLSGHRVTITYNLYFAEPADVITVSHVVPVGLRILEPSGASEAGISSAFSALLSDETILPEGGTIGFALRHQYPLPKSWSEDDENPLDNLPRWLKGSDAALFAACSAQGLSPRLRIIWEDYSRRVARPFCTDKPYSLPSNITDKGYDADYSEVLQWELSDDVKLVFYKPLGRDFTKEERGRDYITPERCMEGEQNDNFRAMTVHMVTEVTRSNAFKSSHVKHYGNEADRVDFAYKYICLTVAIGPVNDRAGVDPDGYDEGRWGLDNNESRRESHSARMDSHAQLLVNLLMARSRPGL